ncbi:MAG TPA: hypothetical protein VJQ46_17195, partial [Gemmatimonadales bacterium]|nr:hypothetical protein [Gemmatimonadales bacterium]
TKERSGGSACLLASAPGPSLRRRLAALSHDPPSPFGRGLAAALALLVGLVPVASAQRVMELGVQAIGTAADPAVAVGGLYGAIRTSQRTRISAALGAGVSDGEAAVRGELLAHFLLNPTRRTGAGVYGAAGIAATEGPVGQGYVVVTLGIEGRPGGRSGWFAEAGVGGGARLAIGYRWRRFPPGWVEE